MRHLALLVLLTVLACAAPQTTHTTAAPPREADAQATVDIYLNPPPADGTPAQPTVQVTARASCAHEEASTAPAGAGWPWWVIAAGVVLVALLGAYGGAWVARRCPELAQRVPGLRVTT